MIKSAQAEIAGVISSRADLDRAFRMRNPPGLFELRLDALAGSIEIIRNRIDRLPAPAIITARHPREGGANNLSLRQRRDLLQRFLPHAAWLDIELRSARALAPLLKEARARKIRTIISFHDFRGTPGARRLDELVRQAARLGADLFKVATRTDTPAQLKRLLDLFERSRAQNVAAMGIGKLGRKSRLELARRGCPLNYAHLGVPRLEGQLSIRELRRALR